MCILKNVNAHLCYLVAAAAVANRSKTPDAHTQTVDGTSTQMAWKCFWNIGNFDELNTLSVLKANELKVEKIVSLYAFHKHTFAHISCETNEKFNSLKHQLTSLISILPFCCFTYLTKQRIHRWNDEDRVTTAKCKPTDIIEWWITLQSMTKSIDVLLN